MERIQGFDNDFLDSHFLKKKGGHEAGGQFPYRNHCHVRIACTNGGEVLLIGAVGADHISQGVGQILNHIFINIHSHYIIAHFFQCNSHAFPKPAKTGYKELQFLTHTGNL